MGDDAISRIPSYAGDARADHPRGPNGRRLCRWCNEECPPARNGQERTFCGPDCVHQHRMHTQPSYQARRVLERDNGTCEACGRDCVALLAELVELRRRDRARASWCGEARAAMLKHHPLPSDDKLPGFASRCRELELPRHLRPLTRRLWEMDHRVPVAEGGGSCGLENLRTLCWSCHGRETAALASRRARARKEAAHG